MSLFKACSLITVLDNLNKASVSDEIKAERIKTYSQLFEMKRKRSIAKEVLIAVSGTLSTFFEVHAPKLHNAGTFVALRDKVNKALDEYIKTEDALLEFAVRHKLVKQVIVSDYDVNIFLGENLKDKRGELTGLPGCLFDFSSNVLNNPNMYHWVFLLGARNIIFLGDKQKYVRWAYTNLRLINPGFFDLKKPVELGKAGVKLPKRKKGYSPPVDYEFVAKRVKEYVRDGRLL